MIHIFHGEHIEASRKELTNLKQKSLGKEVVVLDGKSATITQLTQATESTSLFGTDRLVIVENFLHKKLGRGSSESKEVSAWIKKLPDDVEIVFWEEKELGKTILGLFPAKTDVAIFKPDRSIFSFVESLNPGKRKEMLTRFEVAAAQDSVELIFAMIVRQMRFLILAKELGRNIGLSPWQVTKLTKQTEYFTLPKLLEAYERLLTIDVTIKSGKSPFSLKEELELWLISL